MIIEFEIGDQSGDGHSQSDTYTFDCKHEDGGVISIEDIKYSYKIGSQIIGFDLVEDCCDFYEEHKLSEEEMDKLVSMGYTHEDIDEMREECIMSEHWMDIYMFICKLGYEGLIFTPTHQKHLNIGGYGLFQ